MRLSTHVALMLFLLSALLSSCAQQGEKLAWDKVADDWGASADHMYTERSPQISVITSLDTATILEDQIKPTHFELVKTTDFSLYYVVAVFQGEKGTTGYSVDVAEVRRKDNTITIQAQFHAPPTAGPGEIVALGSLQTSPYYILRIKKTPELIGNFTFILVADVTEMARQEYEIP